MTRYQYSLVKYVHNAASGECVNVGLVLYAPDDSRLRVQFNARYSRISKFFQGAFDGGHYRSMVRHLESEFSKLAIELNRQSGLFGMMREAPNHLESVLGSVLPIDSTTFQWGPIYGGLVEDVDGRFDSLYDEFVVRHEKHSLRESREEYQIWSDFEKRLISRALSPAVQPQMIETPEYKYEFKGSFTNGRLNVLEPISFDLIDPTSIVEKANTWVGRLTTLRQSTDFLFNGILAPPVFKGRASEFERAVRILRSHQAVKHLIVEGDERDESEALLRGDSGRVEQYRPQVSRRSLPPQRHIHRSDQALSQSLLPDRLEVAAAGEERVDHVRVPLHAPSLQQDVVDLR